jgi:hypothetical protein
MEVAIFVLVVVRVSLKWGGGDGRVGVFAARHQNLERARGSFPLQHHDFIFTHQLQPSINVNITDPSPYHWIMIR